MTSEHAVEGVDGAASGTIPSTPTSTSVSPPWLAPAASGPIHATIRMPGTKSGTNRYLVLAALSTRSVRISRPLWARDTHLMVAGLRSLGVSIDLEATGDGQADVVVTGPHAGGRIGDPRSRVVDCGNAGTVARFLPTFAALTYAPADFDGDPRMRERPMGALLNALRELGATITAGAEAMPFTICGPLSGGSVVVDASASSQVVSSLLLSGPGMGRGVQVRHEGPRLPSLPHIRMTMAALREAGAIVDSSDDESWTVHPGDIALPDVVVEPDLSTASAFLAAAAATAGSVTLADWPDETEQPGKLLPDLLRSMGCTVTVGPAGLTVVGPSSLSGIDVDLHDFPEAATAVTALAVLANSPSRLRGIAHLRGQETDRLAALSEELGRLGAAIEVEQDGLSITPSALKAPPNVVLDPRADHRLAMAYAVVGLRVPGVLVSDIATTGKTIADFPQRWAAMVEGTSTSRRSHARMDEDDVRVRPSKGTRPRTRTRPSYSEAVNGMVTTVDRGRWTVDVSGVAVNAVRGADVRRQLIVVGDIVSLIGDITGVSDTMARIIGVAPRTTILRRTPDDIETTERPVVANADLLVIVCAVTDPPPQPRLIDRCLVAAYDGGLTPLLCLTKTDLADPAELLAAYQPLGVDVVTAKRTPEGSLDATAVRAAVQDRTSVFFGPSGVGKSTLVNELVPGSKLAVGRVSEVTGKGRHTSSSARALRLPDGRGWVIDTPGIRSFGLGAVSIERVVSAFPDLAEAAQQCLPNCTHAEDAPDCRLEAEALATGASRDRVASLRRLLTLREDT